MKSLSKSETNQWVQWITRNKLNGIEDGELVMVMERRGFSSGEATLLISDTKASPVYGCARAVMRKAMNLESLLNVHLALAEQVENNSMVERRSSLSREDFHAQYYALNRPVVITDLMDGWPAYKYWSPEYFMREFGEMTVEIQAGRKTDPVYEVFLKGHSKRLKMAEFVEMVLAGGATNDYYLTANDRLLEQEGAEKIIKDFWPFPEYLNDETRERKQFLWFGPKGAVSPLHRDRLNVFMSQVYGRKRVRLISSHSLHLVYNYESFFSEVDCEHPNLEKFPLFARADMLDVVLQPGEVLFIPVGWWHHIRSLEISINVSFTNFVFNNDFEKCYLKTTEKG